MANGKIIYTSDESAPVTYTFERNYSFSSTQGYLNTDDRKRAHDGTLNSYAGSRKRTFELVFNCAPKSQLDALLIPWMVGSDVDLYLDGTNKDATVLIMEPPLAEVMDGFINGEPTYSFSLMMEEV